MPQAPAVMAARCLPSWYLSSPDSPLLQTPPWLPPDSCNLAVQNCTPRFSPLHKYSLLQHVHSARSKTGLSLPSNGSLTPGDSPSSPPFTTLCSGSYLLLRLLQSSPNPLACLQSLLPFHPSVFCDGTVILKQI